MPGARAAVVTLLLLSAAGCARGTPVLPSGSGTAFPGFEAVYEDAVRECRGARTVVAELGLSGRAGSTKLRGRINAGLASPADIRLEGIAFGRPIFILAGRDGRSMLWLPRDGRVVRDAPPERIVEALAGVSLTPAELRAAVAGCGLGVAAPASGRMFTNDWAAVDSGSTVTYLRRIAGSWRVAASRRGPLTLLYDDFQSGVARAIHLRTSGAQDGSASATADITLRVSQLEINTTIDPRAFEVEVPRDAEPLSLEELRRAGPLGERKS